MAMSANADGRAGPGRQRPLVGTVGPRHGCSSSSASASSARAAARRAASPTSGGLVLVVGAMVRAGAARARWRRPSAAQAERMLLRLYGLGLVAVVLYCLQSDLPTLRGGQPLEHDWPKLATALGALWPAPVDRGRLAHRARRDGVRADGQGAAPRDAAASATRCARAWASPFALVFVFTVVYVRPSATRRSTSPTSARRARARSCARSCARSTSRSRSRRSSPRQRGARGGGQLPRRPRQGVEPAHGHALRLRHRSPQGQGARRLDERHRWSSCGASGTSCWACPCSSRRRATRSRRSTRRCSSASC